MGKHDVYTYLYYVHVQKCGAFAFSTEGQQLSILPVFMEKLGDLSLKWTEMTLPDLMVQR